jgi:hypothetical protein
MLGMFAVLNGKLKGINTANDSHTYIESGLYMLQNGDRTCVY